MGGFGTWDAITRWPHRFAAAVPICGGGDTARLPNWPRYPSGHSTALDTIVKPGRSRDMIAAIRQAGGNPKYTEYPTVAHDSWNNVYADPELYSWLFAQKANQPSGIEPR